MSPYFKIFARRHKSKSNLETILHISYHFKIKKRAAAANPNKMTATSDRPAFAFAFADTEPVQGSQNARAMAVAFVNPELLVDVFVSVWHLPL